MCVAGRACTLTATVCVLLEISRLRGLLTSCRRAVAPLLDAYESKRRVVKVNKC